MLTIPQHILLRELGGSISFDPFKRNKEQYEGKPEEEAFKISNRLSQDKYSTESKNKVGSLKRKCHRYSSHPRINSNIVRHSYRILKHLISSENRTFTPVHKEKHPIVHISLHCILVSHKMLIMSNQQ